MVETFREYWGMGQKMIYRCPICKVEIKKGMQCRTHKVRENNAKRRQIQKENQQ